MPYLTLSDDVPLFFVDEGEGTPIVLLNALMFNASFFWQRNIPELSKHCRVIGLDLRGQGLSGKPNFGYSIAQFARDLDEILTQLELRNVVLVGVSLGGFVSLQYLRDFGTERIGKLVLCEMTPRLPSAPGWEHPTFGEFPIEAARGYGSALRENRSIYRDFFNAAFLEPPTGKLLEDMVAQTYLTPTDVVADIIDEMAERDDRETLKALSVPTALFYGYPNNRILPTALGQWMQSQISDSRLVLFDRSSHSCFWEEADKFNRELIRFSVDA